MSDLIVARIRRPHGVKGEVLVALDTDRPRHVFRRGRVLYLADRDGVPTDRRVVLTGVRAATGGAILRLEGVESRDEADALRGHTLLIRRSEAAPADREEIHFRDLVGLTALADGGQIGTVTDILEIAPGQTLVVRASDGREILIPFVKDMVEAIDLAAGKLELKLPPGLLEL